MTHWMHVTPPTPLGAWGDVCPETATIGATRHRGQTVIAMSAGVAVFDGGQDGPKAFAAERREVPT